MNGERIEGTQGAWPHDEPPGDFVDRVMARVAEEPSATPAVAESAKGARRRRASWGRLAFGGAATLVAAAAAVLLLRRGPPSAGEARAGIRREIAIGSRAVAVAEPDAHLAWRGDEVTQDAGDVFYRVEPGGRFVVHTPAGDVEVRGTCFRVRVGAPTNDTMTATTDNRNQETRTNVQLRDVKTGFIGAAIATTATVLVYEGKVAVSHAGQPSGGATEVTAGQAARLDASGAHATPARDEESAKATPAGGQGSDSLLTANANLAEAIREYNQRLNALTDEKSSLQKKLTTAQEELAAAGNDASAPLKSAYDLSAEDWKGLAARGVMRMRYPCLSKDPWIPTADDLQKMGLAPADGPPLHEAYAQANARIWGELRPLCASAAGGEAVAERLGPEMCLSLLQQQGSPDAARHVAEMRAGLRPLPSEGATVDPAERMYLLMTDEQRTFETDLAKSFGPDEAHRIMYGDSGACFGDYNAGPSAEVMPR